jgi:hypothetical protein
LKSRAIPYFVTGSVASTVYSEARFTNDIDVIVELTPGMIDSFCSAFPEPEYICYKPAVVKAVENKFQFNILHPTSGLKIDVIISSNSDFDKSRFSRSQSHPYSSSELISFSSPEDVILMKLVYYKEGESSKHIDDIAKILATLGDKVDIQYVQKWAAKLNVIGEWKNFFQKQQ